MMDPGQSCCDGDGERIHCQTDMPSRVSQLMTILVGSTTGKRSAHPHYSASRLSASQTTRNPTL